MRNRIRALRQERKLTLLEVATRAGTNIQNISRIELGHRPLTDLWMHRIAAALHVAPADLLPGKPSETREMAQSLEEEVLLFWWRKLTDDEKLMVAAMARAKGLTIINSKPKKRTA
jgi:transcriptional regulator with XRE-family HTH domain